MHFSSDPDSRHGPLWPGRLALACSCIFLSRNHFSSESHPLCVLPCHTSRGQPRFLFGQRQGPPSRVDMEADGGISCFLLCKMPPAQRVSSVSFILSPVQVLCSGVCQGSKGPSAAESTSARQSWQFLLQDLGWCWGLHHTELKGYVPDGASHTPPCPLCH